MVARIDIDPAEMWNAYQETGSLRGAGRMLGIGHMVVRSHLEKAGYSLEEKKPNPESLSPKYKVYVRPGQFEALDSLAKEHGLDGRHAMARELLDKAIKDLWPEWEAC